MTSLHQPNTLELARAIDSFLYESIRSINKQLSGAPLSLKARTAAMLGEFVTGILLESDLIQDAELEEDEINRIEKAIFDAMLPELKGIPENILFALEAEGGDMIRGYKLNPQTNLELVA